MTYFKKKLALFSVFAVLVALAALQHEDRAAAYNHTGDSWAQNSVTYFVNPNIPDATAGDTDQQIATMQRAASEWKSAGQIPFQFSYGGTTTTTTVAPNDGTNAVFYSNKDGNGALAVCTWSSFSNGDMFGFDIEFYDRAGTWDFSWSLNPTGSQFDVESVAVHEFGHALGMSHSDVSGSTMYASISAGSTQNRTLHADDIAGVNALYGSQATGNPAITDAQPVYNWIGGGGRVTVTGTELAGADPQTVTVDGFAASEVTVIDDTSLSFVMPTGTQAGFVDLQFGHAQGSTISVAAVHNDTTKVGTELSITSAGTIDLFYPGESALSYQALPCYFFLPGFSLELIGGDPGDNRILPVNDDALLQLYLTGTVDHVFQNFAGSLDSFGIGQLTVAMPNVPAFIGQYICIACFTWDVGSPSGIRTVSNITIPVIQP